MLGYRIRKLQLHLLAQITKEQSQHHICSVLKTLKVDESLAQKLILLNINLKVLEARQYSLKFGN